MATTTLTVNPQVITVSGTGDNEIDYSNLIKNGGGKPLALITILSGTTVRFNSLGSVDLTNSATYTAGDKEVIELNPATNAADKVNLHYRGGAGSETFKISIVTR